eukprot:tig00000042_g15524.t1
MDQERSAKRSRKMEPSSSAAGPSEAASCSGQQDSNPFARLPDALVQQIFSNLDAGKAYEESKLWAVDRRFRQLLPGVLWKSITVDADVVPGAKDTELQAKIFQKQLQRFAERLGSRQMLGVKHLDIRLVLSSLWEDENIDEGDGKMMQHAQDNANRIAGLLASAATAAVPLESIDFGADWYWWRSTDIQRELGLISMSLEHVAALFMLALAPAPLKSMNVPRSCFAEALAMMANPGCAPALREFKSDHGTGLSKQRVARLVAAFPALRSLNARVEGGEALQEIAGCAHLEELIVSIASLDEHVADALAAIAAGPSGAKLRKLVLNESLRSLNAQWLASVLLFTSLEELSIAVWPDCAALLPALGRLERLKALNLTLSLSEAADGGAGLLRAGAALLRSRSGRGLEECMVRIRTVDNGGPIDAQ